MGLVGILVGLLVLAFFLYILKLIIDLFPIPGPIKNIIILIIAFIALIFLLSGAGVLPGGWLRVG